MTLLTEQVESPEILKTDTLGRVWTPREKREELVAAFERSGMSAAAFAKWSGVKYPTFAAWVQKVRRSRSAESGPQSVVAPGQNVVRWAEAVCEGSREPGTAAIVVHLGAGVRVEARDGRVAAELLTALGVRAC